MEDIAQVYSHSLFDVAKEHDVLDEVHDQLGQFADALSDSRELQVFFFSPYFSSEEKKEGVRKLIEGGNEFFVNFLQVVAEKHRMPALFRIRRAFDELWQEANRLLSVRVTSAIELDDATLKEIGKRIEEQTDRRIELESDVDPDVLGGLVVRVGNQVLDASIHRRLEQLRKQLARAA
jgi:ATP synthase F1 delta subunit